MRSSLIRISRLLVVSGTAGLMACSSVKVAPARLDLSDASVSVVTAREAGGGRGPIGITDRFTTDGQVFAFVSIVWPPGVAVSGAQAFQSRWYSGEQLISQREATFEVTRSPFNFWSNVFPVNLGIGPARYELHVDGRKVAAHAFTIVPSAH